MGDHLTADICVIGGGSGGLTVAAAAAAFGVPVVLIEKGAMGGDCLNTGCVPSKALIAAASQAQAARSGSAFGVDAGSLTIDFARVHDHVHGVIAGIAPHDSVSRFTGLGVRVIEAEGRFAAPDTVVADDITIKARRFVIATGSAPAIPPIPGLDGVPFLTNETIFSLRRCPRHLVIVGAGPIGMELAQAHRRLGADVTVVEAATPLPREEAEMAAIVIEALKAEGVRFLTGATVDSVAMAGPDVAVDVTVKGAPESLVASHLLVATGRRAVTEGLGLLEAGIAHDRTGILVDHGLRTSNRRVYAIGDAVAGGPQFTHAAGYQAGLVVRSILFRLPVRENRALIPRVTYTDPEIAHVGLDEDEARRRHGAVKILTWSLADNDRARAERRTEGKIKVIATRRGRILGASIVGPGAGDLIAPWALALSSRLSLKAMTGFIPAYPTLSEASRRVAISHFLAGLTNPFVRRLIAVLRVFG